MTSEAEPNHKHPTKQTSVAKFPKHRYAGTSPHILRYLSAYHGYIEQLQRTERKENRWMFVHFSERQGGWVEAAYHMRNDCCW